MGELTRAAQGKRAASCELAVFVWCVAMGEGIPGVIEKQKKTRTVLKGPEAAAALERVFKKRGNGERKTGGRLDGGRGTV